MPNLMLSKSILRPAFVGVLCMLSLATVPAYAFFDSGSDSVQPTSAQKKSNAPVTLGDAAALAGPFSTLASVGLDGFKTLWIPAKYTKGTNDQLYINGRKYAAPGGNDNVIAFLPASYGYLVAVHQPLGGITVSRAKSAVAPALLTPENLAKMTPTQQVAALQAQVALMQMQKNSPPPAALATSTAGPHVVFYQVSHTGETLGSIAEIPAKAKAWVTNEAIFVAQPIGSESYNFVGYSPGGGRVDGPQGATSATPGPNGDWYWFGKQQRYGKLVDDYNRTDRNGQTTLIREGDSTFAGINFLDIHNTEQAFADLPPLTDTVRTGRVLYSMWESGQGAMRGPSSGIMYVSNLNLADSFYVGRDRNHSGMFAIAQRAGLFGNVSRPLYAGQALRKKFKEPGVNLYVMNAAKPDADYYPLYNVMGRGMNIFRSVTGSSNSGNISFDTHNDLLVVITPKTTVGIKVRVNGNEVTAFDLMNKTAVAAAEVRSFVAKYGLALE